MGIVEPCVGDGNNPCDGGTIGAGDGACCNDGSIDDAGGSIGDAVWSSTVAPGSSIVVCVAVVSLPSSL